jgi:hypothetical protein
VPKTNKTERKEHFLMNGAGLWINMVVSESGNGLYRSIRTILVRSSNTQPQNKHVGLPGSIAKK